jgi:hypothetical protein
MPRGQTDHLEGKRTGRPRGTWKRSRLLGDLRWAYETIDEPSARPPSAGAKHCKDLALSNLLAFLELLGKLEALGGAESPMGQTKERRELETPQPEPATNSFP